MEQTKHLRSSKKKKKNGVSNNRRKNQVYDHSKKRNARYYVFI